MCRARPLRTCACLVAAVLLAAAGQARAGPVQYLTQSRAVVGDLLEDYQVIGEGTVHERAGDSAHAPDFSDFDGAITVEIDPPEDQSTGPEGSGRVTASQRSSLRDAGVSAEGFLSAFSVTFGG